MARHHRHILTLAVLSIASSAIGAAKVKVDRVTHGSATFTETGPLLTIRAADRTVINYKQFDVAQGETVRFVQPSARSRVLNRINSPAPSRIDGALQANGIVYFVNPSGVLFGPNSVVNVGQLYAASGNISDANFLNNVNHFQATGPVVTAGRITASQGVGLVGKTIANTGTIEAEGGLVTMVAGDDILLGTRDGHLLVKIGSTANPAPAPAVAAGPSPAKNSTMTLASGDMYSLAIGGRINVSNPAGKGGTVVATGRSVNVQGATITASGKTGGGTILVGGDLHGSASIPAAQTTVVNSSSTFRADAISTGNGGKAVVWADGATRFAGSISAKGGASSGDGGLVEVSGKDTLAFAGTVNTSAPHGAMGTLLLDPSTLTINNGAGPGDLDSQLPDTTGDPDVGSNTIAEQTLESLAATTNVILDATGLITVANLSDNLLNLQLNGFGSLTIRSTATGGVTFADPNDQIATAGAPIAISASGTGSLDLGRVSSHGGAINLSSANDVNLGGAIDAGSGDVRVSAGRDITAGTSGLFGDVAGTNVSLTAGRHITVLADSYLTAKGAGAMNVVATAGDVTISDGQVSSENGPLTVTAGGAFTIDRVGSEANLRSTGSSVTINADHVNIGAVDLFSAAGPFTFRTNTPGQNIDLGGADSADTLGLSQFELASISTTLLRIGSPDSGSIILSTPIDGSAFWGALSLQTAGNLTGGGTITVNSLALRVGGSAILNNDNSVGTISHVGGPLTFRMTRALTVGTTDGVAGINTSATSASVQLVTDALTIADPINAGSGIVTVQSRSKRIDLGPDDSADALGLTQAEFDRITASQLSVVSASGISVLGPLATTGHFATLDLQAATGIGQFGGPLSTPHLAVHAHDDVNLQNGENDFDTFAAVVTAGGLTLADANTLSLSTANSLTGLTAAGAVSIVTPAGLTIAAPFSAASLTVGGPVTFNTPIITTTGTQTYQGPASLASNVTLSAGGAVEFLSIVNGPFALTVSNGANQTTFVSNVGLSSPLAALSTSGPTTIGSPSSSTQVRIAGGTISIGGELVVQNAVTVRADNSPGITLHGNVEGTVAGQDSLDLILPWSDSQSRQPVITFAGPAVGARVPLKSLGLNAQSENGALAPPTVASIAATSNQPFTVHVTDSFAMGRNEKLTVTSSSEGAPASLAITVDTGTATLGDLSALGAITVSAPHVRLQQRAPGQVIRASNPDDPITDAGLDLISGQSTVTLDTPDLAFVDSNPSDTTPKRVTIGYFGSVAPTIPATPGSQLKVRQLDTAFTPADLLIGSTVLDLGIAARPTPGPTTTVDPSIAIAGATHPFLILPPDDLGFATFVWDQLHDETIAARQSTNAGPLATPPTTMPATRPASTASAAIRSDDRE